jgi:hypothetical protein
MDDMLDPNQISNSDTVPGLMPTQATSGTIDITPDQTLEVAGNHLSDMAASNPTSISPSITEIPQTPVPTEVTTPIIETILQNKTAVEEPKELPQTILLLKTQTKSR